MSISQAEYRETVAKAMPEAVLLQHVRDIGRVHSWLVYHTHRSERSEPGFPDLVLVHARASRIVFAELKRQTGHLTQHQQDWVDGLSAVARSFFELAGLAGQDQLQLRFGVYVWRPCDLLDGSIEEVLRP